jgi:hypothetical protein
MTPREILLQKVKAYRERENMTNLEKFLSEYKFQLRHAVETRPEEYAWKVDKFDEVYSRMEAAIKKGAYNKESTAFKKTCKKLNIKFTYKAIKEYIGGQP